MTQVSFFKVYPSEQFINFKFSSIILVPSGGVLKHFLVLINLYGFALFKSLHNPHCLLLLLSIIV